MPTIEALNQFPVVLPQCTIRFFDAGDAEQLQAAADNPRVSRYMFNGFPSPYTAADAEFWVKDNTRELYAERIAACPPGKRIGLKGLCIEVDGRVCGGIGYGYGNDTGHRTIGVGYWLAEPAWGRGIATAATRWLLEFIAREEPWAVRLEALVYAPNAGSRRVLEKNGFACECVRRAAVAKGDGIVYDGFMMVRVLEERLLQGGGAAGVGVCARGGGVSAVLRTFLQ
ncbi:acyl-CoA N-acyltransferase [Zopfochytrium polystomum]|nr:acyl-CoA N-acyltransferase [Zopfochytrium polystomum]